MRSACALRIQATKRSRSVGDVSSGRQKCARFVTWSALLSHKVSISGTRLTVADRYLPDMIV